MFLAAIGVVVRDYDGGFWHVDTAKLALAHVFRITSVLVFDFICKRVFAKHTFD